MTTVITYGTFDLFHVGHVRLLKRLSELGDRLVVGISTDEFNDIKGKKSFYSYDERSEIVQSCRYVDAIFPESNWEQKVSDIKKYSADIFAIGDDWQGKFDALNEYCQVLYLSRTENISTTQIKQKLSTLNKDKLDTIESTLHDVIEIVKAMNI